MSHVCTYCGAVVEAEGTKPPRCPDCGREVIPRYETLREETLKKEVKGWTIPAPGAVGTIVLILVLWWLVNIIRMGLKTL